MVFCSKWCIVSIEQKQCLHLSGINSPDTALYESLKLLCSLLVTLVGKGLYGTNGSSSDMRFIDQGMLVPTHGLTMHGKASTTFLLMYFF